MAQFPTIPDSVRQRAAAMTAAWDSLDRIAWQKTVSAVMKEMLGDRPFVPWTAEPQDLKQAAIPAFPGAEGGGMYAFGGQGGMVFIVTSLADSGLGTRPRPRPNRSGRCRPDTGRGIHEHRMVFQFPVTGNAKQNNIPIYKHLRS